MAHRMQCMCLFCLLYAKFLHSAPHNGPSTSVANHYVTDILGGTEQELVFLKDYAVDFAHLNGVLFLDKTNGWQSKNPEKLSNHFSFTWPFTLFPSPYPRELYEHARHLQDLMAEVHLRVSMDYEFIKEAMDDVAKADPNFIGKMVDIMSKVKNDRRQSGMTLILQRTDYLTHLTHNKNGQPKLGLKQVEVTSGTNAGQGTRASDVHRRLLDKVRMTRGLARLPGWFWDRNNEPQSAIPGQAKALYETWVNFRRQHDDPEAVVLLISAAKRRAHSHGEQLSWAQYRLEEIARDRPWWGNPHLVQITIEQCRESLTLDSDRHLIWNGGGYMHPRRVAVAIWLDGYLPKHFPTEADWKKRLEMEQSEAVMQPNVFVYFTGTKRMQQVLAEEGKLERFFPEAEENTLKGNALKAKLAQLRDTFIDQWGLGKGTEEEQSLLDRAIASPGDYVLKENLEGGDGNHFGEKLAQILKELKKEPKKGGVYILMRKIRPFSIKNALVPRPPKPEDEIQIQDFDTELSIFGSLLAITGPVKSAPSSASAADEHFSAPKDGNNRKRKLLAGEHSNDPVVQSLLLKRARFDQGQSTTKAIEHDIKEIQLNTVDGYLCRSKMVYNDMCTVSTGQGGSDSLVLFPLKSFLLKNDHNKCPPPNAQLPEQLGEVESPADAAAA